MSKVCSKCEIEVTAVMLLANKFVCGSCYMLAKNPAKITSESEPVLVALQVPALITYNDYHSKMAN